MFLGTDSCHPVIFLLGGFSGRFAATVTVSVTAVSALSALSSSSSWFLCCLGGFDSVGISDGPPSAAPGEPFRQPHWMVESSSARGQ